MLARRRVHAWRSLLLAGCALAGAATRAGAEDRASFHAVYFREVNTRVIQPMVEVTKDLPAGYDVGAHFAVDAISSASIAQGTMEDNVFHENRYEGSLSAGKSWQHLRLGVFGRYSRESDYFSHTGGVTFSQGVWGNTGTINASVAYTHDDIVPTGVGNRKKLDVLFAGLSYAQALSPNTVVQGGYDFYYQKGFLGNTYIRQPGLGSEELPDNRLRHAISLKAAQYFPGLTLGVQLLYRLYFDTQTKRIGAWGMVAHTIEPRVFKQLGREVELRLGYRYHHQAASRFWCDARADISCYGDMPQYHSYDPKFGALHTSLVEAKIFWDLRALGADTPLRALFSAGTIDLSYGYFFESTYYGPEFNAKNEPPVLGELAFPRHLGGAHLIQTGYSLPF
jgi:hypothetical protein